MVLRGPAALLTVALAILAAPAASSATSPDTLFRAMLLAGQQQHSVHYVSVQQCGCAARIVEVTDAGATEGIQRVTVSSAGQIGHVTVLVTGGGAYVLGDVFSLVNYMGYKPEAAATYAGQWIQIPPTDPDYRAVSADVTLPSLMADLYVPGPLALSRARKIAGRTVMGVTGRRPATATSRALTVSIYAQAHGLPLPVEEDVVNGLDRSTVSFSRWNEPVQVDAPADNVISIMGTGLE
jgi:hypothetical protein